MRMTPQPQPEDTVDPADVNLTKISDSLGIPSQVQDVPTLLESLSNLQIELKSTQSRLQASVSRGREVELALERRQTEYEDLTKQMLSARNERDEADRRAAYAIKQKETFQERLVKKDEDMQELRSRLETERGTNLSSTDSNVAELTRLRAALAEAEVTKEKAVNSAKSKETDLDFFRARYQEASNTAAEHAERLAELEKENEILKKQASGEASKLKQMSISNNHAALEKQVQNLRMALDSRERLLRQKDEEIRNMKGSKGLGMGTRAASVPRSPRVGGATSRAASPLPGGRVGTLRNG